MEIATKDSAAIHTFSAAITCRNYTTRTVTANTTSLSGTTTSSPLNESRGDDTGTFPA
ncbi:MAG: hypothetical protein M3275_01080 [Thermoproteota archaeon]|nr:hypothetical protein [Thermoproteota archaeon]MDQ3966971.1 hypothetical protein [Thermoproteota archaeon]